MCKHFNIDVGPQALQCSCPSVHLSPPTSIKTHSTEKSRCHSCTSGFKWAWIFHLHVSSPWRDDYLYLPLLSGMASFLGFLFFFWRATGSYVHREQGGDANTTRSRKGKKTKWHRTAGFIDPCRIFQKYRSRAGWRKTPEPTVGNCTLGQRRAVLIIRSR